ncbi:MAG TPA: hypothetical protein VJ302_01540 [Blastocatellia bacterium]|nr:hypothetical protein [Blastocatellia bacterium]
MTTHIRILIRLCCAVAAVASIDLLTRAQEQPLKFQIRPNQQVAASLTPQTSGSQGRGRRGRTSDEEESERTSRSQPPPVQSDRIPKMEMGFRYWFVKSSASVTVPSPVAGTPPGAISDLNLDSKNAPEARWAWQFTRRNKLRLDYVQVSTSASASDIARLLSSAGFNVGDLNSVGLTELKTRQLRLGYAWQGLRVGDKFRLGPMVEWRGVLFDADTTTPTGPGGSSVRNRDRFGLAMLNVGADLNIQPHQRLEIASTFSGIPVAGLGRVVDIDNEVRVYLEKRLNVSVGYRYLKLRADSGSNFAELEMRGPMVGVGVRF